MLEIEGDAFIMATIAMQYAIRSLQMQNYAPQQIEDLVRMFIKQNGPRLN